MIHQYVQNNNLSALEVDRGAGCIFHGKKNMPAGNSSYVH